MRPKISLFKKRPKSTLFIQHVSYTKHIFLQPKNNYFQNVQCNSKIDCDDGSDEDICEYLQVVLRFRHIYNRYIYISHIFYI